MGSLGTLHLHTGDSQVGFTVAQSQVGCLGALGTMGASLAPGLWLEDSLLLKGKPHLRLPWRHRYWFLCGAEPHLVAPCHWWQEPLANLASSLGTTGCWVCLGADSSSDSVQPQSLAPCYWSPT